MGEANLTTRAAPFMSGGTIPDELPEEIVRDEAVASIDRAFDAGARVVYVRLPTGAGKSVLLAQFLRSHSRSSIGYFVGADMWSSQPQLFLFDLCQQLLRFL